MKMNHKTIGGINNGFSYFAIGGKYYGSKSWKEFR